MPANTLKSSIAVRTLQWIFANWIHKNFINSISGSGISLNLNEKPSPLWYDTSMTGIQKSPQRSYRAVRSTFLYARLRSLTFSDRPKTPAGTVSIIFLMTLNIYRHPQMPVWDYLSGSFRERRAS